jgi:hypothetical protein
MAANPHYPLNELPPELLYLIGQECQIDELFKMRIVNSYLRDIILMHYPETYKRYRINIIINGNIKKYRLVDLQGNENTFEFQVTSLLKSRLKNILRDSNKKRSKNIMKLLHNTTTDIHPTCLINRTNRIIKYEDDQVPHLKEWLASPNKFDRIEYLIIRGSIIQDLTIFGHLRSIMLQYCGIRDISQLNGISIVALDTCPNIMDLSPLGNSIEIALINLPTEIIPNFESTMELSIVKCPNVKSIPKFDNMVKLGLSSVNVDRLSSSPKIENLNIISSFVPLEYLSDFPKLRILVLRNIFNAEEHHIPISITFLCIHKCPNITNLSHLINIRKLFLKNVYIKRFPPHIRKLVLDDPSQICDDFDIVNKVHTLGLVNFNMDILNIIAKSDLYSLKLEDGNIDSLPSLNHIHTIHILTPINTTDFSPLNGIHTLSITNNTISDGNDINQVHTLYLDKCEVLRNRKALSKVPCSNITNELEQNQFSDANIMNTLRRITSIPTNESYTLSDLNMDIGSTSILDMDLDAEPDQNSDLELNADTNLELDVDTDLELDVDTDLELDLEPTLELDLEPTLELDLEPTLELDLEPTLELDLEPTLELELEPTLELDVTSIDLNADLNLNIVNLDISLNQ